MGTKVYARAIDVWAVYKPIFGVEGGPERLHFGFYRRVVDNRIVGFYLAFRPLKRYDWLRFARRWG